MEIDVPYRRLFRFVFTKVGVFSHMIRLALLRAGKTVLVQPSGKISTDSGVIVVLFIPLRRALGQREDRE